MHKNKLYLSLTCFFFSSSVMPKLCKSSRNSFWTKMNSWYDILVFCQYFDNSLYSSTRQHISGHYTIPSKADSSSVVWTIPSIFLNRTFFSHGVDLFQSQKMLFLTYESQVFLLQTLNQDLAIGSSIISLMCTKIYLT